MSKEKEHCHKSYPITPAKRKFNILSPSKVAPILPSQPVEIRKAVKFNLCVNIGYWLVFLLETCVARRVCSRKSSLT